MCIQDKCPYTPDGNLGFDGRNCYIRPAGWTTDLLMPCYYDTDLRQASLLAKHSLCGPYRLKLVTCPKLSVPHWVARGCNWYLNMTPMRIGVPVNDANQDDYPCSAWIMVLSINAEIRCGYTGSFTIGTAYHPTPQANGCYDAECPSTCIVTGQAWATFDAMMNAISAGLSLEFPLLA